MFERGVRRIVASEGCEILQVLPVIRRRNLEGFDHDTVAWGDWLWRAQRACRLIPIGRRRRGNACDRLAVAMLDRRGDRAFDQDQHGNADSRLTKLLQAHTDFFTSTTRNHSLSRTAHACPMK
jgi:hypothetical protein